MEIGRHTVLIKSNTIKEVAGKPVVSLGIEFKGDEQESECLIWLTEKSMGIARKQLKLCGFDPDKTEFSVLVDEPEYLAGHSVDVVVEDRNGTMRASIPLSAAVPKKEIDRLQGLLRSAKKGNEPDAVAAEAPAPTHAADTVNTEDIPF